MKSFAVAVNLTAIDKVTKVVQGVTANVTKGLHNIESASERMQARLKRATSSPLGAMIGGAAAYVSWQGLKNVYEECIQAAEENILVHKRLDTLMKDVKGTTTADVTAMEAYSAALTKNLTIGNRVELMGASQLATFQLQPKYIQKLLPALNDLAVGTWGVNVNQEQMWHSANQMGKALMGQVGALQRVGITMDDNQKKMIKEGTTAQKVATIIDVMKQNYGGLAVKMAQTDPGKALMVQKRIKAVQSQIGTMLLPLKSVFLDVELHILQIADNVMKWAQANPVLAKTIGGVLAGIAAILLLAGPIATVVTTVGTLITTLAAVPAVIGAISAAFQVGGIAGAISTAFVAWPVLVIIAAIAILAGLAYLIIKNWDKVRAFFVRLWVFLTGTSPIARFIQVIFPVWGITLWIIKNWDKVKKFFVGFWVFLTGNSPIARFLRVIFPIWGITFTIMKHWKQLKTFFGWMWDNITSGVTIAWDGIKRYFEAFVQWFINLWSRVTNTAAFKAFDKAAGWVSKGASFAWNVDKAAIGKVWNWATSEPTAPAVPRPAAARPILRSSGGHSLIDYGGQNGRLDIHLHGAPAGTRVDTRRLPPNTRLNMGVNGVHP